MKHLYFLMLLASVGLMAQPVVRGKVTMVAPAHDRDFIVRHTKVILVTKSSQDTVSINDKLQFEFRGVTPGTAAIYLSSPVLPSHTQFKFRVRKKNPTSVTLIYDKFQTQRIKTAEEQEEDLTTGLIIARLALDLAGLIHAVTR